MKEKIPNVLSFTRLLLITTICLLFTLYANAQTVSGNVLDAKGQPIPGARITIKGTTRGTVTDTSGKFTIAATGKDSLIIQSVGLKPLIISAANHLTGIQLEAANLDEVVVIGFGDRKKKLITSAITQVGAEVFRDRPVSNAGQALQGQVPGLQVTRTSARPGNENLIFQIRGASSLGQVDPLIIVDGVPVIATWELNTLNPSDIESVSVLKDASAAIYGARAQGGVILITTRRGKGRMQINANSNFRLTTTGITVPWANMQQWAKLYLQTSTADKRDANGNPVEWFPQWKKENLTKMAAGEAVDYTEPNGLVRHFSDNNWQNALYGDVWSNQQDVSVRGATDKTGYMFSIGYSDNRGQLKTAYDGEKKYTVRLNYDYKLSNRVKLESGFSFDNRNVQSPRNGVGAGFFDAPIFPTYNSKGEFYDDYGYRNPVAMTTLGGRIKTKEGFVRLNSKLTVNILDGLKLSGAAAITKRDGWETAYNQTYSLYNWLGTAVMFTQYAPPNNPNISEKVNNSFYQNYLLQLDYNVSIARDHNITAMVATNAERLDNKTLWAGRSQLQFAGLYDINTAISPSTVGYAGSNSGGSNQMGIYSYVSRITYDYRQKYLLEMLGRRDGSSRFSDGYKWADFYGVSSGWRIAEENFFKEHAKFLNELKLSASYGETGGLGGSDLLGLYDYVSTIGQGTALFGTALQNTAYVAAITTNQRTWEKMINKNLALDFAFFKSSLSGRFEIFEKKNQGMLVRLPYTALLGGAAPATNSADMRSRGWELTLNWKSAVGKVKYNIGFNIWNAKNIVTRFDGAQTWNAGKNTFSATSITAPGIMVGNPLNAIYVFQTKGVFNTQQEADDYYATYGKGGIVAGYNTTATNYLRAGDVQVVDRDGDGRITVNGNGTRGSGDTYLYGDADPHLNFGINMGLQWNGFDLTAYVQGVGKWNILRVGNARAPFYRNYLNVNTAYIGKTWTAENPNAEYPRLSFDSGINGWNWANNDVNIQKLRYARLKTLVIGYTLPASIASKITAERIRFYFSGNDLFEIMSVNDGFDPERGESSDNSYPFSRTWSFGVNIGF